MKTTFKKPSYNICVERRRRRGTGVAVHVRPGRAADESVERDVGRLQRVRDGRVREPGRAHQRRSGQGADADERQVHVSRAPDAQPGHRGVGLLARGHTGVQLVQVPGRRGRVLETPDIVAADAFGGGGGDRRLCGRGRRRGQDRRAAVGNPEEVAVHVGQTAVGRDAGRVRGKAAVRTAQRAADRAGRVQRETGRGPVPVGRGRGPAQGRARAAPETDGRPDQRRRPAHGDHAVGRAEQKALVVAVHRLQIAAVNNVIQAR